ncbi:hypothetical protein BO85DRAFT_261849 [Aspergillus piperis CBS 112811]|uniref:Uncharacterized protein n=1 Tax=Aspergillus piperis CBS 112811 TaxID=1448313 RepID=A0A8G1R4K1_9EURO|nr:hypothetical protein BO85DRAFT_261849 [Aspergillus piperis CBS 112811]RAH59148.1 hypothetical protein BO85DRAFT_261849 [Aspergillus piperis CBS 112811]
MENKTEDKKKQRRGGETGKSNEEEEETEKINDFVRAGMERSKDDDPTENNLLNEVGEEGEREGGRKWKFKKTNEMPPIQLCAAPLSATIATLLGASRESISFLTPFRLMIGELVRLRMESSSPTTSQSVSARHFPTQLPLDEGGVRN